MSETSILVGRAYWASRERGLLASAYPGDDAAAVAARKLDQLAALGIAHIVNLMEPDEVDHQGRPFRPYEPEWQRKGLTTARFPIRDVTAPTPKLMRAILDDVDLRLKSGGVLVHCWGGRGRTGTVVGCWLVRHGLAAPASACEAIARLRAGCADPGRDSPETEAQRRLVRAWRPGR